MSFIMTGKEEIWLSTTNEAKGDSQEEHFSRTSFGTPLGKL